MINNMGSSSNLSAIGAMQANPKLEHMLCESMAEDFKSLQATMTEEEFAGFLRGIEFVCGIFPKAQELILENPSSDDVELRKVAEASNYITYIVRTIPQLSFRGSTPNQ
ncbi:MAG: hypothetical protein A9181_03450 [Dehalococcoides mccartyi]|nr:MAG: hypothetical protein A9181_03450 [Dehalococcoides mccartyi]